MKIGFLFNHDAAHQIPHTLPIAVALAARGADVEILTSSVAQHAVAQSLLPPDARLRFTMLDIGPASRAADALLRHALPFRRVAILRENLEVFRRLDALVVPETTSTLLKTHFGLDGLKLIYMPHGAGDGAAGFQEVTKHFDLVLLSGRKIRDRMLQLGLISEAGHAIIGYPKFDAFAQAPVKRFFDNGRPTVLYNPHFNPHLSSWYKMGRAVLTWFAAQDRFNLIFAPHVMLFKRRLHITPIHKRARLRPGLPARFQRLPHVLIDKGSDHSIDMSYVRAADIYIGDVSSQIYEWIQTPRPAIFFNTHQPDWQGRPDYTHWALGEVIETVRELPGALERVMAAPQVFSQRQRAAAEATFSVTDQPAGARAAAAILSFLEGRAPRSRDD